MSHVKSGLFLSVGLRVKVVLGGLVADKPRNCYVSAMTAESR